MLKLYWSTQPGERPVLQEAFTQDHAEPCLSTTRTDVTRAHQLPFESASDLRHVLVGCRPTSARNPVLEC